MYCTIQFLLTSSHITYNFVTLFVIMWRFNFNFQYKIIEVKLLERQKFYKMSISVIEGGMDNRYVNYFSFLLSRLTPTSNNIHEQNTYV